MNAYLRNALIFIVSLVGAAVGYFVALGVMVPLVGRSYDDLLQTNDLVVQLPAAAVGAIVAGVFYGWACRLIR